MEIYSDINKKSKKTLENWLKNPRRLTKTDRDVHSDIQQEIQQNLQRLTQM